MIPNYKRPQINDYIFDILERPMTDEDLEMINYLREIEKENQKLKKQLEEYQLQNVDLRTDIMIQKMSFPNKLIKDKTFYDLYDMPTYEELKKQVEDLFSENRNLRKKLENCMTFEDYKDTLHKKIKLKTQQKEFIKFLEDNWKETQDIWYLKILYKYEEIIGVKDGK